MPNKDKLIPFQKGFDPRRNTNGAPRKLISSLSDIGYSNREINDTMMNIIALTLDEIKQIEENESCTALERTIAKAVLNGAKKGSLYNIETIITRAMGKPRETTQVESNEKIEVVFIKGKTIL
jgi:hypothetical protein